MIYINDFGSGFELELRSLCKESPFGARIEAYFTAYRKNRYSFLDFWICSYDKKPQCVICRYYDTVILCGSGSEEIDSFIEMLYPRFIFCDSDFDLKIRDYSWKSGETMRCVNPRRTSFPKWSGNYNKQKLTGERETLLDAYSLLKSEFIGEKSLDSFDDYFIDMSHRIRHRVSDVVVVYDGEIPVSTLTVVAVSRTSAVIGSIATRSDYRCKGIAGRLVGEAVDELYSQGKAIFLHREKHVRIYEKAGFRVNGGWKEYLRH